MHTSFKAHNHIDAVLIFRRTRQSRMQNSIFVSEMKCATMIWMILHEVDTLPGLDLHKSGSTHSEISFILL